MCRVEHLRPEIYMFLMEGENSTICQLLAWGIDPELTPSVQQGTKGHSVPSFSGSQQACSPAPSQQCCPPGRRAAVPCCTSDWRRPGRAGPPRRGPPQPPVAARRPRRRRSWGSLHAEKRHNPTPGGHEGNPRSSQSSHAPAAAASPIANGRCHPVHSSSEWFAVVRRCIFSQGWEAQGGKAFKYI